MSTAVTPVSVPPLQWSHWYPCGPGFDVSHVPEVAGLCVIGRKTFSGVGVVHVEAACNLQQSFRRLFDVNSPILPQLREPGCLMRYVPIAERCERTEVLSAIQTWTAGAGQEPATSIVRQLLSGGVFQP